MKKKFLVLILALSFMIPLFTGFVCFAADDWEPPVDSVDLSSFSSSYLTGDTVSFGVGTVFSAEDLSNFMYQIDSVYYYIILADTSWSNPIFAIDTLNNNYYINGNIVSADVNYDGDHEITLGTQADVDLSSVSSLYYDPNIYVNYVTGEVPLGSQIADAMTGTFTLGTSILSALVSFFDVFVLTDGSLSWITIFLFALLGISLVVGMTRWLTSLIRRKI